VVDALEGSAVLETGEDKSYVDRADKDRDRVRDLSCPFLGFLSQVFYRRAEDQADGVQGHPRCASHREGVLLKYLERERLPPCDTEPGFGRPYRRGVGSTLLIHIIRATLEVRISNEAARRFYLAHGLSEVAVRKGYYHNPHEDALAMVKLL